MDYKNSNLSFSLCRAEEQAPKPEVLHHKITMRKWMHYISEGKLDKEWNSTSSIEKL